MKQLVERRHETRPPVASTATAVEQSDRKGGRCRNPTMREGAKGETKMKKTYTMIALIILIGSMAVAETRSSAPK